MIPSSGYIVNEMKEAVMREMTVPVHADCIDALPGSDWTLFYCFECGSSQWVSRKYAWNRYRHNILWLRGCPECSREFGGLYFTVRRKIAGPRFSPPGYRHRILPD